MMGGSGVIASFLDEGEIDGFIIHVVPAFIGEGIPTSRLVRSVPSACSPFRATGPSRTPPLFSLRIPAHTEKHRSLLGHS
jgi:hypothetical protein